MSIFGFSDLIISFCYFLKQVFQNKKIEKIKKGVFLLIAGIIWIESAISQNLSSSTAGSVEQRTEPTENVQKFVNQGFSFRTPQEAPPGCEKKLDKETSVDGVCDDIPSYEHRTDCFADDLIGSSYDWSARDPDNLFTNVLNYGKKSCHCCQNPSKCMFGKAGGLVTFLEGIGVIGGLAAIGGVSKVCKDIGKLQAALAGLNGTAGVMCRKKGSQCEEKHTTCLQKADETLLIIKERIASCKTALENCKKEEMCTGASIPTHKPPSPCTETVNEGIFYYSVYKNPNNTHEARTAHAEFSKQASKQAHKECTSIKTSLESIQKNLRDLKTELTTGKNRCEFSKQAGNAQLVQGGVLGLAGAASFLCAKKSGGSAPDLSCTDDNNAEYNSLKCQCERREKQAPECCEINPTIEGCSLCLSDPQSAGCRCQSSANRNLQICRQSCAENPDQSFCASGDSETPPAAHLDPPRPLTNSGVRQPLSNDDFDDSGSPFGDPNIQPPSKNEKNLFNPGASSSSKANAGGPPSVSGGSLPSLGGSGGSTEEGRANGAGGGESDPYLNLLDGLTGKTNKAERNSSHKRETRSKSRDKMFDFSKLFPKKDKREPASGAEWPLNHVVKEDIFEKSSRMTQIYCNQHQIECKKAE